MHRLYIIFLVYFKIVFIGNNYHIFSLDVIEILRFDVIETILISVFFIDMIIKDILLLCYSVPMYVSKCCLYLSLLLVKALSGRFCSVVKARSTNIEIAWKSLQRTNDKF